MKFVPARGKDVGITAAFLLQLADEKGIDRKLINTTKGGFKVPDELLDEDVTLFTRVDESPLLAKKDEPLPQSEVEFGPDGKLYLNADASAEEIAAGNVLVGGEERTLATAQAEDPEIVAERLYEEALQNDAQFAAQVEAKEAAPGVVTLVSAEHPPKDLETIRAWAKENGFTVSNRGALKKAVLEAYDEAHS